MKKTLLAIGAVLAVAGCSKSEIIYSDSQEISMSPVSSVVPKGGPVEDATFPEEMFKVISYYGGEVPAGTSWASDLAVSSYFEWTTFKKLGTSWAAHSDDGATHKPKYWPKEGSLFFAGYYPAGITGTAYDFTKPCLNISGYTQKDYTGETSQDDLMWFDVNGQTSANAGPLAVKFKHALSWITIKVKAKDEASSKDIFTVKSISFGEVSQTGDFTSKPADEITPNWTNLSNGTSPDLGITETVITDYTNPQTVAEGLLIIPQNIDETDVLTVKYTQEGFYKADGSTLKEFSLDLKLKTGETSAWEMNKHYIYTLIFSANEILLSPEVGTWEDGSSTDITIQ